MVLLQNSGNLLPMSATGKKVWLYNIDATVAAKYGYTVVATPQEADVAIVRVSTPYETLHPHYIFGSMQHEAVWRLPMARPITKPSSKPRWRPNRWWPCIWTARPS